jgi:hypothetical protein
VSQVSTGKVLVELWEAFHWDAVMRLRLYPECHQWFADRSDTLRTIYILSARVKEEGQDVQTSSRPRHMHRDADGNGAHRHCLVYSPSAVALSQKR